MVEKFTYSYDYEELRKIFFKAIGIEDEKSKSKSHGFLIAITVILIILLLFGGLLIFRFIRQKKASISIDNLDTHPLV